MGNKNIARVLKYYRNLNNLSIEDVSEMLKQHNHPYAPKTIYGWETGKGQPRADILMLLCEIYKINDVLSAFGYKNSEDSTFSDSILSIEETKLVDAYRNNQAMRPAVDKLLDLTDK